MEKQYPVMLTRKQILFLFSYTTAEEMKAEELNRPEALKFVREVQDALVEATSEEK
jgi:hypothetical protein